MRTSFLQNRFEYDLSRCVQPISTKSDFSIRRVDYNTWTTEYRRKSRSPTSNCVSFRSVWFSVPLLCRTLVLRLSAEHRPAVYLCAHRRIIFWLSSQEQLTAFDRVAAPPMRTRDQSDVHVVRFLEGYHRVLRLTKNILKCFNWVRSAGTFPGCLKLFHGV